MGNGKRWRLSTLLITLAMAAVPTPAQEKESQSKSPAAAHKPTGSPGADSAEFTGSDACQTCHEEEFHSWEKSPHWKITLEKENHAAEQGCESCHGPGKAHVTDPADPTKIFSFKKATAKETNGRCLDCHARDLEHASTSRSAHTLNKVTCLDCHSAHHPAVERFQLVKSQPQLCFTCHLNVKPQFNMPFHHRVDEGIMQCSDCHNAHGSSVASHLRTSHLQDAVCFTCHADKPGPYVFEHQPVKTEGCMSCHVPHGSPNPRLLKVSQVNLLCLQCHTVSSFSGAPGTPSFHNQSTQFQACTLCHTQIHGSNFSAHFFK